ncbi:MAG: patatin-like phospholipase family protein, partial [Rhodobacteraceae bacterium]|nr:patatin-like phospholipase family protein [Paracoccaceae bacterium]
MDRPFSNLWRSARVAAAATAAAMVGFLAPQAEAQIGVDRPGRLALVLSGGGAAGAAHVGVIRALEEVGLRPDCVAGTSMGAIVGGLYASGMGVEEMENVVSAIDWLAILDDTADRGLIHPMRRRARTDPRVLLNNLPVGADEGGVRTDAGLIDGNRLLLILRELTLDTAGVRNFDNLDLPFRAVATNLATGEAVEIGEGDLAVALRASMSLPGLFPPIVLEEQVLVDGGVANN